MFKVSLYLFKSGKLAHVFSIKNHLFVSDDINHFAIFGSTGNNHVVSKSLILFNFAKNFFSVLTKSKSKLIDFAQDHPSNHFTSHDIFQELFLFSLSN
jgi:hypothetical protein